MAFSSLDEILAFAVAREIEAAAFYAELAGKARFEAQRALLRELEAEERQHRLLLEKYRAGCLLPPPGAPVPDMGLTASAGGEVFDPAASAQDALIVAARKEAAAADLYGRLAATAADSAAREMFEFLVRQELRHKFRLESEYEARVLTED